MKHWIYCWELGGGLGHLARMKAVSAAIAERGGQVSWCVPRHLARSAQDLWPRILLAPESPRPRPSVAAPGSLAEILQNEGWNQGERVSQWVSQWQQQFDGLRADRVLLDFAPNALLAAVAAGRRVDVAGTGFYIPPRQNPLPAVRADHGIYADRLLWAEKQLVSVISAQLAEPINGLMDLFHHSNVRNHLLTYPAMDHYGVRSDTPYTGVVTGFSGDQLDWPRAGRGRVFAYLKPFPHLHHLLRLLDQAGANVQVHGNAEVATVVDQSGLERVKFCARPIDERSIAQAGGVMINHAGHDGTIKAVRAGIALWQLPLNMEQLMTARNAQRLGAADWLSAEQLEGYPVALERLFAERETRCRAGHNWADSLGSPQQSMQQLLDDLDLPGDVRHRTRLSGGHQSRSDSD